MVEAQPAVQAVAQAEAQASSVTVATNIATAVATITTANATAQQTNQTASQAVVPTDTTSHLFASSSSVASSYRANPQDVLLRFNPNGADRNCVDFSSQDEAQVFFQAAGGSANDQHGLDPDGNGFACDH